MLELARYDWYIHAFAVLAYYKCTSLVQLASFKKPMTCSWINAKIVREENFKILLAKRTAR